MRLFKMQLTRQANWLAAKAVEQLVQASCLCGLPDAKPPELTFGESSMWEDRGSLEPYGEYILRIMYIMLSNRYL